MTENKWYPGITIGIDPDAILDYTLDFTQWLEGGALAGVVASATNCICGVASVSGNTAKVRVSAVTEGASVKLRATTADGQADDFTVRFMPAQQ
jgi:carbohydrate-binding DOMON domain-containing protein